MILSGKPKSYVIRVNLLTPENVEPVYLNNVSGIFEFKGKGLFPKKPTSVPKKVNIKAPPPPSPKE